jgi:hypothetical protein
MGLVGEGTCLILVPDQTINTQVKYGSLATDLKWVYLEQVRYRTRLILVPDLPINT